MSSGTKQTTNTSATMSEGPWAPSQGILQSILGQAGGINTGVTPMQNQGIANVQNAANVAAGYSPQIQGLSNTLFGGGGFGTGVPGIQTAQGTAANTLGGIASGSLDPMQNPNTAPLIQSIIDQVNHSVGDQFAAAGRGGIADSGYGTRAYTTGLSQGLAAPLLNQYNQNVANAMGASNSLVGNAINSAGAYDAAAGNRLNAQMAGPGSLQNFGIPGAMQIEAGRAPEQTAVGNLGTLSNLILPIAALGKQGSQNETSTTQQQGNLLQTLTGGLLGGLGLVGQSGGFGSGGWLSGLFGGGGNAANGTLNTSGGPSGSPSSWIPFAW